MNFAIKREYLTADPMRELENPKHTARRETVNAASDQEIVALLKRSASRKSGRPRGCD